MRVPRIVPMSRYITAILAALVLTTCVLSIVLVILSALPVGDEVLIAFYYAMIMIEFTMCLIAIIIAYAAIISVCREACCGAEPAAWLIDG